MGKSLDFVKKETGLKKGFEFNADMVFDNYSSKCKIEENLWCFEFMRPDTNEKFEIKVKYDPEADFDGWVGDRCICDGTFSHYLELAKRNLICIGKYELERKSGFAKNRPAEGEAVYVVGNFIWAAEDSEEFGTPEKPWMNSRFVSYLPLKCEIQ
jgi:hypothetical protein|nr:MAG TPA: hypothetical protein [Bacteriophage sp.]